MCPHVDPALIAADRENLEDSVFAIKHNARFLYDAGDSMISLAHVRAVIGKPPAIVHGKTSGFCDFAGAGDESVLATCEGNDTRIVDAWRHKDTMHSVGKFLNWFRKLGLQGWMIGGDEGYGHQLMDRMAEQDFHLHRVNNGSPAERNEICQPERGMVEHGRAIDRAPHDSDPGRRKVDRAVLPLSPVTRKLGCYWLLGLIVDKATTCLLRDLGGFGCRSAQLLSHNLPVMIDVLRANFVAIHLNEGRARHPNTATRRRRTVRTGPVLVARASHWKATKPLPVSPMLINSNEASG
jgi:hypothetical protein